MKFKAHRLSVLLVLIFSAVSLSAQSSDQNFPTPVTENEISGTIKARDVGDSRLTTYYYTFDTAQGDLFVNILAKNFTGDIDVFNISGLRPISKIVVYSDFAETETGRLLYFRKPEKLLLRVQGRSPGDEPATFRIKFGGSFVAAVASENLIEPELPKVKSDTDTGIRVNSVGTILAVVPKPSPSPTETVRASEIVTAATPDPQTDSPVRTEADLPAESEKSAPKMVVVVTDNLRVSAPEEKTDEKPAAEAPVSSTKRPPRNARARRAVREKSRTSDSKADSEVTETARTKAPRKEKAPPKETVPDPLEKIQLVILFKDGKVIERPMSEVLRFSVDKGVLTVISKDGSIGRYSIFDVARVSIE